MQITEAPYATLLIQDWSLCLSHVQSPKVKGSSGSVGSTTSLGTRALSDSLCFPGVALLLHLFFTSSAAAHFSSGKVVSRFGYTLAIALLLLLSRSVTSDLCDPMECSTPSFPVLHHLLELLKLTSIE